MIPHACGYSMFGGTEEATNRIFLTKQRAGHKRNSLLCDMETQRELQVLDRRAQDMIEAIAVDYDLPLSVIAPYRTDHPLLKNISADLLRGGTANDTINLYCNAGFFPDELCKLARAANQIMFGSSANLTGTGQKFRISDVQPEVRAIADLIID
jgi:tRNA A37 threonylcarbamoyladenosine synthetase subunit TsaC/SUA5/YrdC